MPSAIPLPHWQLRARTLLPTGMAASSSDGLVFAWTDGRDDNSRSRAVYLNRASAHSPAFGADWRLAPDTSLVNAEMIDPDVTTDGVSSVYTAFGAVGRGPFPEIFVAPLATIATVAPKKLPMTFTMPNSMST